MEGLYIHSSGDIDITTTALNKVSNIMPGTIKQFDKQLRIDSALKLRICFQLLVDNIIFLGKCPQVIVIKTSESMDQTDQGFGMES